VAAVAFWAVSASESDTGDSGHEPAVSSSLLPKRMAEWKDRADRVEGALLIDSKPLLANPQYASSVEFTKQLNSRTTTKAAATGQDLQKLDGDLTAMAEIHQRSAEQFQRYRQQKDTSAATPDEREQLDSQKHKLDDRASQLLALARRLQSLKQVFASPQGSYDVRATAELTALREMESVVAADHLVEISAATLDRAAELAASRNPALAWLAINVLARSDNAQRAKTAIQWLGTYPADRQAPLCWSLLLSGQSESISAAVAHLREHPELVAMLDRKQLVKLAAEKPAMYQGVIPLLVTACETPDERFAWFQIQAPLMNDAWANEIEQSCATGLLRDQVDRVVLEIVGKQHTQAYPLAERLLEKHRGLKLAKLSPAELKSVMQANPQLAGELAQQLLVRGSEPQRAAALEIYCDPRSKISSEQLQRRIETEHPTDPTGLLNQALASKHAKAAELAEFVLTHAESLEPGRLAYAAASPAALERGAVRKELFKLAWQEPERGQAWVLEQLLGSAFVRQFQEADTARADQLKLLTPLVQALDGRLVTLKNVGASAARDRGLQMTARALQHLPSEVDPAPWAPEAEAGTRLAELRKQLEPARTSADSLISAALDRVDRYLSDLIALNTVTFEVTKVYDIAIVKQLSGARREIQLKRLETWDFRFPGSSIENFQREYTVYRELLKSLDATRKSVPIVAREPNP
jgi:hypothetical protein